MPTFTFRWSVPREMREEFVLDWRELALLVREQYGMQKATLFESGASGHEFVSIAQWPTIEAWEKWQQDGMHHPLREKYRAYRISGPERLMHKVSIGQETCVAPLF
jgi:heme-degrading monooxygenase HmoA